MTLALWDRLIIAAYFAVSAAVGRAFSRRAGKSVSEFTDLVQFGIALGGAGTGGASTPRARSARWRPPWWHSPC